jgi:1,4-alpha-glucan branching enzyme
MRTRTWFTIVVCCVAVLLTRGIASADDHEFKYKAPDAKSVELMGEWNEWKAIPMTKGDDGIWTAKVTLSAGTYAYKFLVDGKDWVFDPDNPAKKSVNGVDNSQIEIK